MPFGLATAPETFMRLMTIVFSGMHYTTCLVYLDDIIIFGRNFMEMLGRLGAAPECLGQAKLKLKPSKCAFEKTPLNFMGNVISYKGISTDPEKLRRIKKWPRLHNPDEARSFLGYATYYRKFIKNFAHIVEPLKMLPIKERQFQWTKECENSFTTIKAAFADTITLVYPDFTKQVIVDCDASELSRYPFRIPAMTVFEKWFPPEFKADFVKQQARDSVTSALLAWCKKAQRTRQGQLEGKSQDLLYYWARFDKRIVEDGVLCSRTAVNDGPETSLTAVVFRATRQKIIKLAHGTASGGYFGVQKSRKTQPTVSQVEDR